MKGSHWLSKKAVIAFAGEFGLISLIYLTGCAVQSPPPTETAAHISTPKVQIATTTPTRTPRPTATPEPTASPAIGSTDWDYDTWLAARPRNMEAYGLHYDPEARPTLPPRDSVSMPIWQDGMPLQVIEGGPTFQSRQGSEHIFSPYDNLTMFGCMEGKHLDLYCKIGSELLDLDCESLYKLSGTFADAGPVQGLLGRCSYPPPTEDERRDDYLFRTGCAFRNDSAYIFYSDGQLRLVKTPAELKELFTPIKSPEEAVNYAQLMTGLVAAYTLEPKREYLYFYDPIDATRVELTSEGYRVFLFHYLTCMCEPWVNSEVELLVSQGGDITWVGARPWSMTIGFSCAD